MVPTAFGCLLSPSKVMGQRASLMQVSKIHIFLPLGKAFLLKELSQMASPSFIILLAFTFNSFLKIPLYIMNRKFDLFALFSSSCRCFSLLKWKALPLAKSWCDTFRSARANSFCMTAVPEPSLGIFYGVFRKDSLRLYVPIQCLAHLVYFPSFTTLFLCFFQRNMSLWQTP